MQTEQGVVSGSMVLTGATPPFVFDDGLTHPLYPCKPWPQIPPHPMPLDPTFLFSHTVPVPNSLGEIRYPSAQTGPYFRQGGNGHTMLIDYTSGQDTRRSSVLLDTRKWSPALSFATPHASSGLYLALMHVRSHTHAQPPRLAGDSTQHFSFGGTLASYGGSDSQGILHTQPTPDLDSNLSRLVSYHHECIDANLGHPAFPKDGMSISSLSLPGPAEDQPGYFGDKARPPIMLYRPQEKSSPSRRRFQRASAINVEGLWVDKDDLYSTAGKGSTMIWVHECQWDKSNNPCGMWIIGSRSRVGAHIRKWHGRTYADSRAHCLWDGCTAKAMLKDSVNRHVVTVHLREGFHCQGCNQEFSRQDVYDEHVQKDELCRDVGAAMVYGTECKIIDVHKVLEQGRAAL